MRIAQVAPLIESVPPKSYGGIERVVYYLTEELVRQGHDVTLFASGDSRTSADLCPVVRESLRQATQKRDPFLCHTLQLAEVLRQVNKFDVVHFHTDIMHYPAWRQVKTPQVTTLHGRLDINDMAEIYEEFSDLAIVSISDAQRETLPQAGWVSTVYNGIPGENFTFQEKAGDYFAFLGRISPEKGPERAIEIAKRTGTPLRMAAKIDEIDQKYFTERIEPLLAHPLIEFIGEVNEQEKDALLGGAKALLFSIDWPEPFGLVMTESMACGTPVIAFRAGSVPEVMKEGVSGFIVETVDEAIASVDKLPTIDRKLCRAYFEERFSVGPMTAGYLEVYRQLTKVIRPSSRMPRWTPMPHSGGIPKSHSTARKEQTSDALSASSLESEFQAAYHFTATSNGRPIH